MRSSGELVPLGSAEELFMLAEFVDGAEYADDLLKLRAGQPLAALDETRADALCDYLVEIHRVAGPDPGLYVRRVRELLGHGECIFGVADSYPGEEKLLEEIEKRCVEWRWRIKGRTHRLRQVHGDFHPWNILFRTGADFSVLDRSRGEWGEPADDVTCLALNYLFFSLQRSGRLEGAFERLWRRFWERYLERCADRDLAEVTISHNTDEAVVFHDRQLANIMFRQEVERSLQRVSRGNRDRSSSHYRPDLQRTSPLFHEAPRY